MNNIAYYTSFSMNKGKTTVYCGFSHINDAYIVWREDGPKKNLNQQGNKSLNNQGNLRIHNDHYEALQDFNNRKQFAYEMGVLDSE